MHRFRRVAVTLTMLIVAMAAVPASADERPGAVVLNYHRFGPVRADSMTVTDPVFVAHLDWLKANGYRVITLRDLVDALRRDPGGSPAERAAAITVDDGHRTVYTELFPIIRERRIPVTLFIYPSAISNASYALTWAQLAEMEASGLVDIQSHTYWHPNFKLERRRLNPAAYKALVETQLVKSKSVLEQHSGKPVNMLAWPFGIHDPDLEAAARAAGYVAAFSIDRGPVCPGADIMALPRYLMSDSDRGAAFARIMTRGCGRPG